jgi:hypothetical protein
LRVLALRQIPPKVVNDFSIAVLLERALTLSAAQKRLTYSAPFSDPDLRSRLERDPAGSFRALQYGFVVGPQRAWLIGVAQDALSVATRDAGGRWHIDWRLPLAVDEWSARGAIVLLTRAASGTPKLSDWPVVDYLSLFSEWISGFPPPEDLLRLAEPPRPDHTLGCWEPFLDPTLMLCASGDAWAPCVRCDSGGLCAKGTAP